MRLLGTTLSWQLLKEVLSIYFVITIIVTMTQMGIEYLHTRNMVKDELVGVERTFYPAIARALWEMNAEQLEAIQQGIIELPLISRLRIIDVSGREWLKDDGAPSLSAGIEHAFRVSYQFSGDHILLANVTFEAAERVVVDRLKLGYQMILISALIKSTVLTLLFFWAFRRRLGKPLAQMTAAVSAIDLDNLPSQSINFQQKQANELTELESAYNRMLERLDAERTAHDAELQAINRSLEEQVVRRTQELAEANARLEHLAHTDVLTGVANRRRFIEAAQQEIQRTRRNGTPLALLMIDLDHFKRINDANGHAVGDEVLRNFAAVAAGPLRAADLVARIGGEEFAILLPETALPGAEEVAQRILETVRLQTIETAQKKVRYTVSIGVACLRSEDPDYEVLLARADTALYRAKVAGRNRALTGG